MYVDVVVVVDADRDTLVHFKSPVTYLKTLNMNLINKTQCELKDYIFCCEITNKLKVISVTN